MMVLIMIVIMMTMIMKKKKKKVEMVKDIGKEIGIDKHIYIT